MNQINILTANPYISQLRELGDKESFRDISLLMDYVDHVQDKALTSSTMDIGTKSPEVEINKNELSPQELLKQMHEEFLKEQRNNDDDDDSLEFLDA